MVFYLIVESTDGELGLTSSPNVFERFYFSLRDNSSAPVDVPNIPKRWSDIEDEDACETLWPQLTISGLRLFRASGDGLASAIKVSEDLGASSRRANMRGLLEDAMPRQRTSALFVLAVPCEISCSAFQDFLGESLAEVETMRFLRRRLDTVETREILSDSGNHASHLNLSGDFYSVVILCKTQEGADDLYRQHHGRIFHLPLGRGSRSDFQGGPCCYLAFLDVAAYLLDMYHDIPPDLVPTASYELPGCPFCLERLDVSGTGMVTHNQGWLSAMGCDKPPRTRCCKACASQLDAAFTGMPLLCERCDKSEHVWTCLVCGYMGCGRYDLGHSLHHAEEHQHRFSLELDTGRIWDYAGDVFVHRRLVQMAAASGCSFELTMPAPATSDMSPPIPGNQKWAGHQEDYLAMELDAILASQLDYHRSLHEARLKKCIEEHTDELAFAHSRLNKEQEGRKSVLADIAEADKKRKILEKQLSTARKSKFELERELEFVKELNQSLLANRRDLQSASSDSKGTPGVQNNDGANGATSSKQGSDELDPLVKRLRDKVAHLMQQISEAENSSEATSGR